MSVKEIVTLQVGHYANYVGSHWWNIQESSFVYNQSELTGPKEICHDVLYREGENRRREVTFTPRLVLFDLKGSLKTLKQEGVLYDTFGEGDDIKWLGDVTMHKEDSASKNAYLRSLEDERMSDDDDELIIKKDNAGDEKTADDGFVTKKKKHDHPENLDEDSEGAEGYKLDDHINVWSDFLGTNFHPRTVHVVEEYRHLDELKPFDLFNCATEILSNYETTCEWEDRLHFFAEECDNLQGFHVLMDTHDGFGGLGTGLIRYLEDEFPGKGILTFGFTPADVADDTAQARANRIINSALAYESASCHSSLFVPASLAKGLWRAVEPPVNLPYVNYNKSHYHTSAILASVLDTMSLPYRMDSDCMNLRDITFSFNNQGRKISTLNACFPLGMYSDESPIDFFSLYGDKFPWQPLTPHAGNTKIPFIQSVVMRGLPKVALPSRTKPDKLPRHLVASTTTEEVLRNYLEYKSHGNLHLSSCFQTALKTSQPFPKFFNDNVASDGFISQTNRPDGCHVNSVPMMSSLQCTPEVGGVIQHLYDASARMNIKKQHRYLSAGMEEDDYTETLSSLQALANNYKTDVEAL